MVKVGDTVKDSDGTVGKVIESSDSHNIFVQFDNGGSGLYCVVPTCNHYDPLQTV